MTRRPIDFLSRGLHDQVVATQRGTTLPDEAGLSRLTRRERYRREENDFVLYGSKDRDARRSGGSLPAVLLQPEPDPGHSELTGPQHTGQRGRRSIRACHTRERRNRCQRRNCPIYPCCTCKRRNRSICPCCPRKRRNRSIRSYTGCKCACSGARYQAGGESESGTTGAQRRRPKTETARAQCRGPENRIARS